MKTSMIVMAWLAAATAHPTPPAMPAVDRSTLHVQVILDKLGFSPGVLDGKGGQSLVAALKGFQEARGLPTTGKTDAATLRALYPYRNWRPTVTLTLDAATLAGPFTNPLPSEPAEQAKLPALGYRNVMESLAERFHTTTDTLIALNSPDTKLAPGTKIVFPNALPTSRSYAAGDATWKATLNALNVDAGAPKADHIVVDQSEGVLKAYDADDRLIGQFSATMGSEHDPLPIGTWKILGLSTNPKFHYNPALFWDAKAGDEKATLPPGPNGPVGVVWIDISKPHYGIHGTPEPSKIGRTESHGCIRLTNWDAGRLALMVKAGVPAIFQP
ncbi:MAG: murein L,D-transpeptidase [Sphingomonadaceae bacterium]|nr:murein L,D-transpeptidase [Sphingomonadaceae bacterium]